MVNYSLFLCMTTLLVHFICFAWALEGGLLSSVQSVGSVDYMYSQLKTL